jgi:hypothetical protein
MYFTLHILLTYIQLQQLELNENHYTRYCRYEWKIHS